MTDTVAQIQSLSTYRRFIARLPQSWQRFQAQRQLRLTQQARNGQAAEKVAENIVEDFLTLALDWTLSDLNNQLQYADLVLTNRGIKRLLIEIKRPGALRWEPHSLAAALAQAHGYASQQRVQSIAVSDGTLFYAADLLNGGLRDRARLQLDAAECSVDAWWVSLDGIYRPAIALGAPPGAAIAGRGGAESGAAPSSEVPAVLLHPKHKRPAECFAYVGDASQPKSWKLPYRMPDGSVDEQHLPGAIRAVLSNYRGAHIRTVPEAAMPDVLVRLGVAAAQIRKLPGQTPNPLASYQLLYDALRQIQRLEELPLGPPQHADGSSG